MELKQQSFSEPCGVSRGPGAPSREEEVYTAEVMGTNLHHDYHLSSSWTANPVFHVGVNVTILDLEGPPAVGHRTVLGLDPQGGPPHHQSGAGNL